MITEAPRPQETREVPTRGRYPVPVARIMARVESEHLGAKNLPHDNMQQYRENLRQFQTITFEDNGVEIISGLPNGHIIESSRGERPKVSESAIEEANTEWAKATAKWLQEASEEVAYEVFQLFDIDRGEKQEDGTWSVSLDDLSSYLNELRAEFFDDDRVGGDVNVDQVVKYLSYGDKAEDSGEWDDWKTLTPEIIERSLAKVEPFLYIFGGEQTVKQIKDRALAQVELEAIRHAPEEERETLFGEVEKALGQELPDEDASYYPSSHVGAQASHEVGEAEEAKFPSDADETVQRETTTPAEGSGSFGPHHVAARRSGFGESNASSGGEGGEEPPVEAAEVQDSRRPGQIRKEALLDTLARRDETLLDVVEWYKHAAKETPLGEVTEGPLTGEGAWKDLLSTERVPDTAEITLVGEPKIGDGFQVITYYNNSDKAQTPRSMLAFKTEGGQEVRVGIQADKIEGRHFSVEGNYIKMGEIQWNQPLLREFAIPLELPDGTTEQVSGWVGLVVRPDGRVLTLLKNGAAADYTTVRLAQMSATNYKDLSAAANLRAEAVGDDKKQKAYEKVFSQELLAILSKIYGDPEKFEEALKNGDVPWGDLSPANEDRIIATNKYFVLRVSDELADQLVENDQRRWSTEKELQAFGEAGVLNALGAAALLPQIGKLTPQAS